MDSLPEEELAFAIGKCNALSGHFEVDHGGCGQRLGIQHVRHGALDGLRSGQRFRVHGEQVEYVTGGTLSQHLRNRSRIDRIHRSSYNVRFRKD